MPENYNELLKAFNDLALRLDQYEKQRRSLERYIYHAEQQGGRDLPTGLLKEIFGIRD